MQQSLTLTSRVRLVPKSKSELAAEYEVHRNTVAGWCRELGIKTRKLLTIREVAKIYEERGAPGNYEQQMTLNFQ